MKNIYLHGRLRRFGSHFKWNIKSPKEALRGMIVQLKGFRQEIVQGAYQIIVGNEKTGLRLGAEDLEFRLADGADLHIIPILEGAGGGDGKSIGKIVLGVAIAAIAVIAAPVGVGLGGFVATSGLFAGVTYGSLVFTGAAMALAGVMQLVTPVPKSPSYSSRESPDAQASFIFQNGAVNTSEQGNPVPLVFGRMLVGSIVISAGINIEQIQIT